MTFRPGCHQFGGKLRQAFGLAFGISNNQACIPAVEQADLAQAHERWMLRRRESAGIAEQDADTRRPVAVWHYGLSRGEGRTEHERAVGQQQGLPDPDQVDLSTRRPDFDGNPLNVIGCCPITGAIVELGGACAFMCCLRRGALQGAACFKISRDAGGVKKNVWHPMSIRMPSPAARRWIMRR